MEPERLDALLEAHAAGRMARAELASALPAGLGIAELLEHARRLFAAGRIDADGFRRLAETLTDLELARLENATARTLVMPHPPGAGDPEATLILRDAPAADPPAPRRGRGAVRVGDVLKDRFELVEEIGRGGMGVVFKARDRVRARARDAQPFVAVKVLSEAFRKHRRSFIALQREASKTQRLAHPNIATVYDFDQDGDRIYMTMELLEGKTLDKLLAAQGPDGLPLPVVLDYVGQLCRGLAHAHAQGLVHCDLKPANVFVCDNGTVKLLDFGITRAVHRSALDGGEETLFDPASLNALTPAYASPELFRGETPDPRDDIYALACITYEMLGGRHPYGRLAAPKALELKLTPPPIAGLDGRRQRALRAALSLTREARPASVEAFLAALDARPRRLRPLLLGAAAVVLLLGALLAKPLQTQWREERQLQRIQAVQSGDTAALEALLAELPAADAKTRAYFTSVLRREIIAHYQARINAAIDAGARRYDFPRAAALLAEVRALYPDSASLAEAARQLEARRKALVEHLVNRYRALAQSGGDTRRILAILAEAQPDHPLLRSSAGPE
ncbi:MAG: hypothetical protein KatS3mg121_1175 [Gammaproteobacteria bacterium]|nr:MAG: hypothetical protein KatS3mg121_1175 [Gammaproteobacteria bacterium]